MVRIRVPIGFSVCLVSRYAHVIVLISLVVVTLPTDSDVEINDAVCVKNRRENDRNCFRWWDIDKCCRKSAAVSIDVKNV